MFADSPLVEIINDFASNQDVLLQERRENHEVEEDEDYNVADDDRSSHDGHSLLSRRRRTFAEREYWRKEGDGRSFCIFCMLLISY